MIVSPSNLTGNTCHSVLPSLPLHIPLSVFVHDPVSVLSMSCLCVSHSSLSTSFSSSLYLALTLFETGPNTDV